MWFALPVLITFLLAHWYNRKAREFGSNGLAFPALVRSASLNAPAPGALLTWLFRRSGESPALRHVTPSPDASWSGSLARSPHSLVEQAQFNEERQTQGLLDLNRECQKFSATFQGTLAEDSVRLAREAGVSEQAAFLALMQLFD